MTEQKKHNWNFGEIEDASSLLQDIRKNLLKRKEEQASELGATFRQELSHSVARGSNCVQMKTKEYIEEVRDAFVKELMKSGYNVAVEPTLLTITIDKEEDEDSPEIEKIVKEELQKRRLELFSHWHEVVAVERTRKLLGKYHDGDLEAGRILWSDWEHDPDHYEEAASVLYIDKKRGTSVYGWATDDLRNMVSKMGLGDMLIKVYLEDNCF